MIFKKLYFLKVLLDENGDIVEYFSNIDGLDYREDEVKGKNWFELFIDPVDKEKIFTVFQKIIKEEDHSFKTYKNDLLTRDGEHKLIDFYNQLLSYNKKKYTFSIGMEHLESDFELLKKLAKKYPPFHQKR